MVPTDLIAQADAETHIKPKQVERREQETMKDWPENISEVEQATSPTKSVRVDVAERSINTELTFDLLAELGFNFDCRKVELTQTFESESQTQWRGINYETPYANQPRKGLRQRPRTSISRYQQTGFSQVAEVWTSNRR